MPERTVAELIERLKSDEAIDQVFAAEELGERGCPSAVQPLIAALAGLSYDYGLFSLSGGPTSRTRAAPRASSQRACSCTSRPSARSPAPLHPDAVDGQRRPWPRDQRRLRRVLRHVINGSLDAIDLCVESQCRHLSPASYPQELTAGPPCRQAGALERAQRDRHRPRGRRRAVCPRPLRACLRGTVEPRSNSHARAPARRARKIARGGSFRGRET